MSKSYLIEFPVKEFSKSFNPTMVKLLLPLVFNIFHNEINNHLAKDPRVANALYRVRHDNVAFNEALRLLNIDNRVEEAFLLQHTRDKNCEDKICLKCLKNDEYTEIAYLCGFKMLNAINDLALVFINDLCDLDRIAVIEVDPNTVLVKPGHFLFNRWD